MPGPILRQSPLPWWADPKGASVFDIPGQGMLRQLVGWLGLDDPTQIMGLGVPIETGAATGGVLDLLAQKFPRLANAIKAYHGSPHDFEQFDLSKIGTGEGAQAYGHGLYFAEKEGTARSYRDQLANSTVEIMGQQQQVPSWSAGLSPQPRLIRRLADIRSIHPDAPEADVVAQVRRNIQFELAGQYTDDASRNGLQRELEILDTAVQRGLKTSAGGRMYEVAIHADPEHFLDWDKPLSQQSEAIRKIVREAYGDVQPVKLKDGTYSVTRVGRHYGASGRILYGVEGKTPKEAMEAFERDYLGTMQGGDVYHDLRRLEGDEPSLPAWQLNRAGIPGIKYLDQGSRAEGKGTYNYVVFDDRLVEILKKYGIAVTTAAGLADLQRQQQAKP